MDALQDADDVTGGAAMHGAALESSRQRLLTGHAPGNIGAQESIDSLEQVFWFRWIVGHQTTFILWQLLARALSKRAVDADGREQDLHRERCLVRGYSAMLLYAGSCPREVYHKVIRPSMARQHPAFSGAWARDYGNVRALLRGRESVHGGDAAVALLRECRLNRHIHEGIAAKLVPSAPSLLQSTAGHGMVGQLSTLRVLYDAYFMTLRAQVPYDLVVLQLFRRLHAIRQDLAAQTLYVPMTPSEAEKPQALWRPDVVACERSMPEILGDIATAALEPMIRTA
ncbi:hypothetical protein [Micromonospora sp. CB01531]|uniref:hypothetical protein n=1 Tax=Micromonospora sp. CB01531 TaxID=1718947 RepID=UPI00093F6515|nr:hypothetical protein [Micromonospora sp. CB01531]OKI49278.1 hypothetical protein A6A27_35185 [Micromonospora sp. CB01531]